jgi:hypothetical protein
MVMEFCKPLIIDTGVRKPIRIDVTLTLSFAAVLVLFMDSLESSVDGREGPQEV